MRFIVPIALACAGAITAAPAPAPKAGPPRTLVVASKKTGNWELYLVQPGSGETKQLTDDKRFNNTEPAWSPDGKLIAYVTDRGGGKDIFTVKPDGSEPAQRHTGKDGCTNLRWKPDGTIIAFTGVTSKQVYIVGIDPFTADALVSNLPGGCGQPAWSPDGKRLSFTNYAGRYSTYTTDAVGTNRKKLSDENGGVDAQWSPDGKSLVFVAMNFADGGWRVHTIGADGKNQKQLTTKANTHGNVYPQWSPDGTRIAFGELVDGVPQIATMRADGTDLQVVTSKHSHQLCRWSPDGKSLSYGRYEPGKGVALWVSDADGGNAKELMRDIGGIPEWKPK